MNDLAPVAIEFDPQKEFIVDREAIRLLRAGEPVKSIAEKLGLSQMTIRRRMGAVLIRLLTEKKD